jgi:hypothetical protein
MVILRYRQKYPIDIRWLLYFSVSFMGLIQLWVACFFYLPAHTVLEFSAAGLRLTRSPFRTRSGSWQSVKQAYFNGGLFVIRTTERQWPGWAIKVVPKDATIVEDVKRYLPQASSNECSASCSSSSVERPSPT